MVSEPNFAMSDFQSENKKDKNFVKIEKIIETTQIIFGH
jgi:hypothetical protein